MEAETKKKLPRWVTIVLALVGIIPTVTAAVSGVLESREAIKRIDQTWKKMQADVVDLKTEYQKLHLRVVYFQGREEGRTAGVLQSKLDEVQARYDQLVASKKKQPTVEILRSELVEVRRLRAKLESSAAGSKAVKAAKKRAPVQKPEPPPWRQSK